MTLRLQGKRIIIVLWCLELGGAERQAIILGHYLSQVEKASVQIWAFESPGEAAKLCKELGLPSRIIPLRQKADGLWGLDLWDAVWTMAKLFRKERAEVILSYLTPPNIICAFAWRIAGASTCIWNQRSSGIDSSKMDRMASKLVPWFIVNSNHGAAFLFSKLGVNPSRTCVIRNGLAVTPIQNQRASLRQELGLDQNLFCACMTANLTEYKDHLTLIRAWRIVVDNWPSDQLGPILLLAGKHYNTYPMVKHLVDHLDLNNHIRFLGHHKDVPALLGAVDLGILSSLEEGCPNALIEYMAAGLSVVGTDNPGIRETLGEYGHPFLAPPGDHISLADRILVLGKQPDLRSEFGKNNRLRAEAEFSLDRLCRETTKFIVNALDQKTWFRRWGTLRPTH
ncbi:MAG: glycosyltransferase [Desulfobacula sp.]|nr:glycosyltransferase [Desulfobacula sp.]